MAKQDINYGTTAGDGTGESLFAAFKKAKENFTELYGAKTEFVANAAALPATGDVTKVYMAMDTGMMYRWTGSAYAYQAMVTTTPSGGMSLGVGGGGDIPLPGAVARGMSWLTDTLHGIDIYKYFVPRPTLFFDPSKAATSFNRGTFKHPYTTQAHLQNAIKSDMRSQVLGVARGSELLVSGSSGLNLNCYGSSSDPFFIVPYGDAEALPIISASTVISGWTLVDATYNIWSYAQATETDVWQNGSRLWKATWSTNAITTLSVAGEGRATFNSGTLYVRPIAGEDPRAGQMKITASDYSLLLNYSDVAATGWVTIAGLDLRYARRTGLQIASYTNANITTIGGLNVVGCRVGHCGTDTLTSTPTGDGILINGASDAVRCTSGIVSANEIYDCTNNSVEVSGVDGSARLGNFVIEFNNSHEIGGNSIVEFWSSNSGALARYNYGANNLNGNRVTANTFANGGVWFANNYESAGNWALNDTTNAKNAGNVAVFNLVANPYSRALKASGGTGHKFQHNTCYNDPNVTHPGSNLAAQGWFTEGTAATGFCDISNNLFYWSLAPGQTFHAATVGRVNANPLGAAASVPSGNKNLYFTEWVTGNGGWYYNGAQNGSFTSYKTALSAYALDQNSLAGTNFTGGTVTSANLNFNESTFEVGAGSVALAAGLTTLTGIGKRYRNGNPYDTTTPTIGCSLGG